MLLPAPDGPTIATASPLAIVSSTSSSTASRSPSYVYDTRSKAMACVKRMASAAAGPTAGAGDGSVARSARSASIHGRL